MSLENVPFIGDSQKDLQAAAAAGAIPVLVRTGSGKDTERLGELPARTRVFDDLAEAADALIKAGDW